MAITNRIPKPTNMDQDLDEMVFDANLDFFLNDDHHMEAGAAHGAGAGAGAAGDGAGAAAGVHPYLDFPNGSEARKRCDKIRHMKVVGHLYVDWGFIDSVGETDRLRNIIGYDTPWSRLFQSASEVTFHELTVELLSSFEVTPRPEGYVEVAGEPYREISFRLAGVQRHMTFEVSILNLQFL